MIHHYIVRLRSIPTKTPRITHRITHNVLCPFRNTTNRSPIPNRQILRIKRENTPHLFVLASYATFSQIINALYKMISLTSQCNARDNIRK